MLHAVNYRTPAISRRKFLQATGLALVTGFTALSDGLLSWLMRACRFESTTRFAAAG